MTQEAVNPPRTEKDLLNWAQRLGGFLGREFARRPPLTQPLAGVLLLSPGKKVYRVKVSDAGVLSTELVT